MKQLVMWDLNGQQGLHVLTPPGKTWGIILLYVITMGTIQARSNADIPVTSDVEKAVHRIAKERTLKLTGVLLGLLAILIAILIALQLQLKDVRTPGEAIEGAPAPTAPR